MRALVRLGLVVAMLAGAGTEPLFAQTPQLKIRGTEASRCAEIESLGPSFAPLAKVCWHLDSPKTLPNFICTEKMQAFRHTLGSKYQYELDTWTAEVSFDHGTVRYADVAINGHPKPFLKEPRTFRELHSYFVEHPNEQRSLMWFPHFWDELSMIFAPQNNTAFQYRGGVTIGGVNLEVFGFQMTKLPAKRQCDKELDQHPGIQMLWSGPVTCTGAQGLVWIDKATSLIRRVVFHYTEIDRDFPVAALSTSTNYSLTPITGLGEFLLPVAGEDLSCDHDRKCSRGTYSFSNCRKFAAKSRILPGEPKEVQEK